MRFRMKIFHRDFPVVDTNCPFASSFTFQRALNPAVFRRSRAQSCGRNPFADCHGQAPAIIRADFECNDEVSFTDPRETSIASRPAKVSRVSPVCGRASSAEGKNGAD